MQIAIKLSTLQVFETKTTTFKDLRLTWTDGDEAEDYDVPNVLSPRDLVFRPHIMDETVKSSSLFQFLICAYLLLLMDTLFLYGRLYVTKI